MSKKFIFYSLPALVLASMAVSFYVYIPKLYSRYIDIQTLGTIILITRLFDAVTDPLIGYFSDRTNSSSGRRKPWINYSVLPLSVTFALLFGFEFIPSAYHYNWLLCTSLLFFIFWTAYSIPYDALGQELVDDYDQRTELFSYRDGAIVIGTILAALLPAILKPYLLNPWHAIAFIYCFCLLVFTYLLNKKIEDGFITKNKQFSIIKSFKNIFSNVYFRKLLLAYSISSFGAALPATLFLFYVQAFFPQSNANLFLVIYFVIGIIALPLWMKIAKQLGKKLAWFAALLVNTLGFSGVFFLNPGDVGLYVVFISISGLGYGANLVLPSSMQADVIDSEELKSGLRKEGEFLGVWSLAKKTSAALGSGLALTILGKFGFDANLEIQTDDSLFILKSLYCLVPCLCSLLSVFAMKNYNLDKSTHLEIIKSLRNE